eukprot:gene1164-1334_t
MNQQEEEEYYASQYQAVAVTALPKVEQKQQVIAIDDSSDTIKKEEILVDENQSTVKKQQQQQEIVLLDDDEKKETPDREVIVIDDTTAAPVKEENKEKHLVSDMVVWNPSKEETTQVLDDFLETRIKMSYSAASLNPRRHQWLTVASIIKDLAYPQHASSFRSGKRYNYLIQHAAGSGKSITIATLVYCLYKLEINGKLKFDTIVIMNDRSQLDAQLGDVIVKFLEANGIKNYCRPKSAKQLQREISIGKNRIVITTMQKFSQLLPNNNSSKSDDFAFNTNSVAIISDEAHRSHGKSTTERLHEFLVGNVKQTSQITYFSFTCTPTPNCLEMFGVTSKGRDKLPFYTYSMEDALKDNLVLDVISNFNSLRIKDEITFNSFQEYEEWDADIHDYEEDQVQDKKTIQDKSRHILNHFVETKRQYDKPNFKSRGMVVCSVSEQFDTIAAFSPFTVDGKTVVESDVGINGKYAGYGADKNRGIVRALIDDKATKIRLLLVADKLQTGFDEPSLCMMYIDKKIKGANVVQTLSRLSRISEGKQKTAIVDFVNSERDIRHIFRVYNKSTSLRDLQGEAHLMSCIQNAATNIKETYSKERNITSFAKSILYHELSNSDKYVEVEQDIEEFLDIYPKIKDTMDFVSPISFTTVENIKKTLDALRREQAKDIQQKKKVTPSIKIKLDILTDLESSSSIELSQVNIDYDADFAASLWSEKREEKVELDEEKIKENKIQRLKDLSVSR